MVITSNGLVAENPEAATLVVDDGFADLTPLMAYPKLKKLTITGGPYWLDLAPLTRVALEELTCSEDQAVRNRIALGSIKTLKTINGKAANEYLDEIWKKATASPDK